MLVFAHLFTYIVLFLFFLIKQMFGRWIQTDSTALLVDVHVSVIVLFPSYRLNSWRKTCRSWGPSWRRQRGKEFRIYLNRSRKRWRRSSQLNDNKKNNRLGRRQTHLQPLRQHTLSRLPAMVWGSYRVALSNITEKTKRLRCVQELGRGKNSISKLFTCVSSFLQHGTSQISLSKFIWH